MSSSNIKNFMRKFNVSKPTDMPDIPEEKLGPDGRPISMLSQRRTDDKRGSVNSNVSELSTATTHVGNGLGIKNAEDTPAPSGDLLSIPENVQAPTIFGPNNEYRAVPSIIEYSTTRGRSRVSIREATPEEAKVAAGSAVPIISDIPELSYQPNSLNPQENCNIPRNDAPSKVQAAWNDTAIENLHPSLSSHPPTQVRGSVTDSIRTSTTSIRTSTTSDPRTSMATNEGDIMSDRGSTASTLNPPGSPPQLLGSSPEYKKHEFNEKPSFTSGGWSLPRSPSSQSSMRFRENNSMDTSRSGGPPSLPDSLDAVQSRFSWHMSKTEKASNWFTRWFIEWWAMEIASWIFSAICMMTIIIVLWKVDGKPMPKWKLGVSINAFISIFSGFAKSALLLPTAEALGQLKWNWFTNKQKRMMDFEVLDSASRGPWGSMMLLAKTKGITLASVGAAIILLSLPLDLFFQQIIAYPSVNIVDPQANATIARTILYNPDQEREWQGGPPADGGNFATPEDSQMDAFLYPYWLRTGVVPGIPFDCPTGNCTFDPFETLGVDFQCKPLPLDLLEFDCKNTSAEWLSTVAYGGPGQNPNVTSCGYYLTPPGYMPQLMSGYEITVDGSVGEVLSTRFFAMTDIYTGVPFFNGSILFPQIKHPINDFILVTTPGGFDGAVKNVTPEIQECELHWVVKTVQSQVVNGQLFEENIKTWEFESNVTSTWDLQDPTVYQASFFMTLPDKHSVTGPTSTYGLTNTTGRKVNDVWAQIAPSTFTRPSASNPAKTGPVLKIWWLYSPPHLVIVTEPKLPWEPWANVSDHMAQAITVMNQVVRRNTLSSTGTHDVSVGVATRAVTIVDIRWQWITLPVALLVFALIFLITTMWRSSKDKEQIGIWKTSALAILFNGLGEDVQGFVGPGNKSQGYVRRKARDIKVQLDDD
ncbi:uncharacterized protein PV09_03978 [Verruconis gallopava]|uniref:Uncharacterized protein n=1 Tax=Verruconis gallopava TaxID=253628 RepID=A0A0D1XQB0_9PEZI|nr:uncharacterized protein PV09_03978 [Verruconis gallopava]KIW04791.1 hypothetical protein PV09_03978 [Verruconis gallopava]